MQNAEQGPLDAEQLLVLATCRAVDGKLRWARSLAQTNVISLGVFSFFSIGAGLVSLSFPAMGLALGALAWNERRGRQMLLQLDPEASRQLAINQIALLIVVLVYCAGNALAIWSGPDPLLALTDGSEEVAAALRQLEDQGLGDTSELGAWARWASLMVYGAVAAGSLLVQGASAYYYASRRALIAQLAAAPAWARAL